MKKILTILVFLTLSLSFIGCSELFEIEDTVVEQTDENGNIVTTLSSSNLKKFGIKNEENIEIPEIIEIEDKKYVITKIDDYTFKDFDNVQTIVLPNTVTYIGSYAFFGCTNLKDITLPTSLKEIAGYAFFRCIKLETLNISSSVEKLGKNIIVECEALTNLTIDTENKNYIAKDNVIFSKDETEIICVPYWITEYNIPENIVKIAPYAFSNGKITKISIPSNVTEIGEGAFMSAKNLKEVVLPDGLTKINKYTFYGCLDLSLINIPETVTSIGNDSFFNCKNIVSLNIPIGVTEIGKTSFKNVQNINYNGNLGDAPWGAASFNKTGE